MASRSGGRECVPKDKFLTVRGLDFQKSVKKFVTENSSCGIFAKKSGHIICERFSVFLDLQNQTSSADAQVALPKTESKPGVMSSSGLIIDNLSKGIMATRLNLTLMPLAAFSLPGHSRVSMLPRSRCSHGHRASEIIFS